MTECNDCGACCNPVMLRFPQNDMARSWPFTEADRQQRDWVLRDLTPISYREGIALRPELRGKPTLDMDDDGNVTEARAYFYKCRHHDPVSNRCLNYEGRPDVCKGFPWYGKPPHPAATIPPACSFNLDVGRVPVAIGPKP